MPVFDKIQAERIVEAVMVLFPSDENGDPVNHGFNLSATPEALEALKQSDSPFGGYVVSGVCHPDEAKTHYDDWCNRTLSRTIEADTGVTYSMEEVMTHLDERMATREAALAKVKATLTEEEIVLLGIRAAI